MLSVGGNWVKFVYKTMSETIKVWNMTEIDVDWIMIHVMLAVLVPLGAVAWATVIFIHFVAPICTLFPEWRVSEVIDEWLNADVAEEIAARGGLSAREGYERWKEERRVLAQHAMQQRGGDY